MRVKSLTCLPCVAARSDVMNLGDSRIVHLKFEEWLDLEGQSRSAVYDKLGRRYSRYPPVFWEKLIEVDPPLVLNREPENVRTLCNLIERELDAVVKALHWYTGIPPIDPLRSVTYFDPRIEDNLAAFVELSATISENGVQRRYGESGKEYATENESPTIILRQFDEAFLAEMVAFARQTQSVWTREQYALATQSLSLTSASGLSWPSRILLLVGAYESLLLPDRMTELQKFFERRFSCMVAAEFDEVSRHAGWMKMAYQLRSGLIHGRSVTKLLAKIPLTPMQYVEFLSRVGVVALCKLIRYRHLHPEASGRAEDPLWPALDSGSESREAFSSLQTLMTVSPITNITHQWQLEERNADITSAQAS